MSQINKFQILTSNNLNDVKVLENRLIPIIDHLLDSKKQVEIISPGSKCVERESCNLQNSLINIEVKKPRNIILRAIYEFILSWRLAAKAFKSNSDVIIISVPSPLLLLFISKTKRKKIILDIRDISWDYFNKSSALSNIFKNIFLLFVKGKIEQTDLILTTNEKQKEYFLNNFDLKGDLKILPNGVTSYQFKKLREIKNIAKKPTVAYVGNLGIAQQVESVLLVAKEFSNVDFYFIGDGLHLEHLLKIKEKNNISNAFFTGKIQWQEILKIYEKSNILLAQLNENFSSAIPSKLYEYLSTGKHVIYGGEGEARKFLNDFENISFYNTEDKNSLKKVLADSVNTRKFEFTSEQNIRLIKTDFIRENNTKNIFDIFL